MRAQGISLRSSAVIRGFSTSDLDGPKAYRTGAAGRGMAKNALKNASVSLLDVTGIGSSLLPISIVMPGSSAVDGKCANPLPFGSPVRIKFAQ